MKDEYKFIALCVLAGIVAGVATTIILNNFLPKSEAQTYREFYATETLVSVSPSDYLDDLKAGKVDGTPVDLRTRAEYEAGHLVTAVNVPATEMSASQLVAAFAGLPQGKPFITYCYSSYCMLSREVGNALADNGIYAKHFTAGWYEMQRDFSQYIVNGSGAGSLNASANYTGGVCMPGTGDFRC